MKRACKLIGVGLLLVCAITAFLPIKVLASANDFTFRSFDADYYLTRDQARHSHLKVVETLVAEFPQIDQNHGIERAIPDSYDGHQVHLHIQEVQNGVGQALHYETYGSNANTVVRIGDADTYVHGTQTYILTYTMQDVTKSFADHDELFWDTNGTHWSQSFDRLTARLHVQGVIAQAYNQQKRCFVGLAGANDACPQAESRLEGSDLLFTFSSGRTLFAGENVSFVVGFIQGSFAAYTPSAWERLLPVLLSVWLVFNGLAIIWGAVVMTRAWRRYGRSPAGKGVIVPEYTAPKEISALVAASILKKTTPAITAQIIDLAVRHYLKIYEVQTKKLFGSKRSYEIELVRLPESLRPEERQLVELIFGASLTLTVGQRITTELLGSTLQTKAAAFLKDMDKLTLRADYLADRSKERKHYFIVGALLLIPTIVLISPGAFVASMLFFVVAGRFRPLTEKGVEQRDYLEGLKMYMQLAEADRLRQLQSPDGALKMPGVDPNNKAQLVKLYERLLPFAIIYGIEKEWVKQFVPLYDQTPDWYAGNWAAFNGAVFASSLTNFTAVSSTTFAPPSSSSSSGFSGGGSSGGGGGGGGGGGW